MHRFPLACLVLALALALVPLASRAQSAEEIAFARDFLGRMQILTVVENREYCGWFGRDPQGRIRATRPNRGKYNSCMLPNEPPLRIIASYHSHAAFDPDSINEIPSLQDLTTDIAMERNSFIATPGGRLWFSDHRAQKVRQICGVGCLPQDPAFRPGKFMKVRRSYSLADLEWMMGD